MEHVDNKLSNKEIVRPKRAELLMPAGSLDKLKMAVLYGADAIYAGTPDLSLRTKAAFTLEELVEGIEFAHEHSKRVYLTLNLFSHNKDIEKLPVFLETVRKVQPDGLIISDPGVFQFVKQNAPELELHVSTQANVCSWMSVKFWQDMGASLIVMAREVSFPELKEIREKCPDIKLETFVHGAMCMAYSGRCLLSNFMAERGANQGNCAHNCRWNYKVHVKLKDGTTKEVEINDENKDNFDFFLEEEYRPGELMEIQEDERGSNIMNAKDLCLMPKLNEYLQIGIDSLKVEGRHKSQYYVAMVARAYRMAIDDYYEDPENWKPEPYMRELDTVPNRGFSLAFHDERLTNLAHNYDSTRSFSTYEFAGLVVDYEEDAFIVEAKNQLKAGDVLEFVPPGSRETILLRMYEFYDIVKQKSFEVINAGQKPKIRIPFALFDQEAPDSLKARLPLYTVLRKEKELTDEQRTRIDLDKEAHKIEMGSGSEKKRLTKKEKFLKALEEGSPEQRLKTPRKGVEGCCGKGCNGCLLFWHDAAYTKARELFKQKKMGEMFDKNMREVV